MDSIFLKILNMSTGACYVIIAVLIARLLLRRAPKIYSYLLWAVVGFRLCCPFSFRSVFSLFSVKPLQSTLSSGSGVSNPVFFPEVYDTLEMMAEADFGALVMDTAGEKLIFPVPQIMYAAAAVWAAGIVILLAHGIWNYLQIRRSVKTAVRLKDNVWQSEAVSSPFILGFLNPKIYIPYSLSEEKLTAVLEHEFTHLRRRDHLVKYVSFLLLVVHWFNPLVWLAFHLMGKDMEMSCDEAVLKRMKGDRETDKKSYGMTLLDFSVKGRFPAPGPLAFGESAVKSRIKNILRWKEPKRWVSVCAVVFCLAVMCACASNPAEWSDEETLLGVSGVTVTGSDDGLDVSPEEEAGYSALENLIARCETQEWLDVDQAVRDGLTQVEKLDAHHGYYNLSNLLLVEGLPGAYAGAAIRSVDGQEVLNFTLQQDLNEETPISARLTVKLEAAVNAPDEAEVTGCRIQIERSSQEAYRYGNRTILDVSYEELHISEAVLEDVVLRIYNYIPLYAEMNE